MDTQSPDDIRRYVASETETRLKALHTLHDEVVALRQLHNSVAPISRLPPEVFCNIFEYLQDDGGNIADIINATHVCKQWRSIALDAAKLWTAFYINNIEVATTFLARSRNQAIKLFLTEARHPVHHIARLVAPHIARVRVLRVRTSEDKTVMRLFSRFIHEAPKLEELSIEKEFRQFPPPLETSNPLPRLFGGSLPRESLRTLTVRYISFLPRFNGPSVLVSLEIRRDISLDRDFCARGLIEFLQNCPVLERARITLAGIIPGNEVPQDVLVASLPRLERLAIFSTPALIAYILTSLAVPRTTRVSLQTLYTDPANAGYGMVPPEREESLPFLRGVRRVELFVEERRFLLRCFHTPNAYVDPAFEIQVMLLLGAAPLASYFADWPFDRTEVEMLVLTGPRRERADLDSETTARLLAQFPNLTAVRAVSMHPANVRNLALALAMDGDAVDDDGVGVGVGVGDVVGGLGDGHPGVPYTLCRKLAMVELCDVRVGTASFKEALCEAIDRRSKGGRLREVNLSLVDGWSVEDVRVAGERGGGNVLVNLDNCED
ncbi:hypothetical protein C8Q70DRAFT_469945 [Cubamyces menziesii]|uniref:F-box domain-containing protein n=1 Tax=Trametes cubensis TaxID=1111947 RepID=A0AAD7TKS8_9APHY|nr:hypothetical protein C8Q70DRAFT_469945 [Cubamyces menziesii]KAJ8468272.1 hypothetical protein ONZ51_g9753 [Trametes cubensis]